MLMRAVLLQAAVILIKCFGVTAMYVGLILVAGRSYLTGIITVVLGVAAIGFNGEDRV